MYRLLLYWRVLAWGFVSGILLKVGVRDAAAYCVIVALDSVLTLMRSEPLTAARALAGYVDMVSRQIETTPIALRRVRIATLADMDELEWAIRLDTIREVADAAQYIKQRGTK